MDPHFSHLFCPSFTMMDGWMDGWMDAWMVDGQEILLFPLDSSSLAN